MPTVEDEPEKTDDARGEGNADPGKIADEEDEQRPFQRGHAAHFHDLVHFVSALDGWGQPAAEHRKPREPGAERKPGVAPGPARPAVEMRQALHPHLERRFRWHIGGRSVGAQTCGHAHLVHAVHRYSQVSLTGLPPTSSNRRISE